MSLSWQDRPLNELMRLSGPIAASSISYSLMTLTDTLLLARVGNSELAGVALGGMCCFVLVCFSFGLLRAGNTLVAQAVGAGRLDDVPAYRAAALLTGLALGVVTVLVGQVVARLVVHLAAAPAAGAAAGTYIRIRILGAPVALAYVALREVRYGGGDARTPMRATVLANLVNIGLAVLLVLVLRQGVAGAAFATVVANVVELGTLAMPQLRERAFGLRQVTRAHLRALWRLGQPTGVQFVLEVGSFAILSLLIFLLSETEMSGHQIALQAIHFTFLPVWAVGEAAAVLAGQAVGANRDDMVIRVGRLAAAVSLVYSGACALVLALGAPLIVAGFGANAAVVPVAIRLLYVAAVFQMFDAINVVSRGVLRGTGDVRYSAVVGVVTAWVCTPPLTWLLGWRLGLGAYGGWLGLCVEIVVGAVLLSWRVERRGWAAAARRARLTHASSSPPIEPHPDVPAERAAS
jgi:MATE family multidrug resistance protein